jgi:hypothetical protein
LIVTPELILKSIVSGVIGCIDSVILIFACRHNFQGGNFYVTWAALTGLVHFVTKLIAGSLSSLPDNLDTLLLTLIRIVATSLSAWVVLISWREIKHIPEHVREPECPLSPSRIWSLERAHLWVPAILIGALDAYPIGTIKGLLLNKPDLLKTVLSCTLGSIIVGLITLTVAHLVLRIERQLSPFHVGTVILGRVLHLSIFTGITLAILIEWYYVMMGSSYTVAHIWITPFISALLVAVLQTRTRWSQWRNLMEEANKLTKQ